jgi:hypothetical protein
MKRTAARLSQALASAASVPLPAAPPTSGQWTMALRPNSSSSWSTVPLPRWSSNGKKLDEPVSSTTTWRLLAVTKDVETYKFAPDEQLKRSLLIGFLRRPQLFAELLEKYESGLPSDGNLKFELIQRGFAPQTAEGVLAAFKNSVEFAHYFEMNGGAQSVVDAPSVISPSVPVDSAITPTCPGRPIDSQVPQQGAVPYPHPFLQGGQRAIEGPDRLAANGRRRGGSKG